MLHVSVVSSLLLLSILYTGNILLVAYFLVNGHMSFSRFRLFMNKSLIKIDIGGILWTQILISLE